MIDNSGPNFTVQASIVSHIYCMITQPYYVSIEIYCGCCTPLLMSFRLYNAIKACIVMALRRVKAIGELMFYVIVQLKVMFYVLVVRT